MANYSTTNGNADTARASDAKLNTPTRVQDSNRPAERNDEDRIHRHIDAVSEDVKKNYRLAKQTAGEYAERGEAILRDQVERAPMQTIAIAAGLGFIAGLLLRR